MSLAKKKDGIMKFVIVFNHDGSLYGPADPNIYDADGDWSDVEGILELGGHIELWDDDEGKDSETQSLSKARLWLSI